MATGTNKDQKKLVGGNYLTVSAISFAAYTNEITTLEAFTNEITTLADPNDQN